MHTVYCVAERITVLDVQQVRLRVLFALRLVSGVTIFKRAELKIYGSSTASYGKKVSSTYQRYACGTFLPNSLYLRRLFAKALEGCASALSHHQKCTSVYTFDGEFRHRRNIVSDITSGIRAASAINAQRISTATDGGGSM